MRGESAETASNRIAAVTASASTRRGSDRTLVDDSVRVKVRLAGLWTAMMLLYVYADFLSLFRPGQIAEIESGKIGPFDVSQSSLLIASLVVILPALMIALTLTIVATAWNWPRRDSSATAA